MKKSMQLEKRLQTLGAALRKGYLTVSTFLMMTCTCYAAETTQGVIEQGIKTGARQIYEIMVAVVVPIISVVLVWQAYKLVFPGGESDQSRIKKTIITLLFILALVFLGPLIVEQVAGWFSSVDSMSVFN